MYFSGKHVYLLPSYEGTLARTFVRVTKVPSYVPVHVFTPTWCHVYDATTAAFEAVFELHRQNMKGASVPRHRTSSQPQMRHDPGVNS